MQISSTVDDHNPLATPGTIHGVLFVSISSFSTSSILRCHPPRELPHGNLLHNHSVPQLSGLEPVAVPPVTPTSFGLRILDVQHRAVAVQLVQPVFGDAHLSDGGL